MEKTIKLFFVLFFLGCTQPKLEKKAPPQSYNISIQDTVDFLLKKGFIKVGIDSNDLEGYFLIAKAYEIAGDTVNSLSNFNALLKVNPEYFDGLLGRGILLNKGGKYNLALTDLTKANTIKKNDYYALFHLGYSNYKLNNFDTAIGYFTNSLKTDFCLNSNCAQSYYYMGLIKIDHLHDTLNGCVDLKKAIAIDPSIRQYLDEYVFCQ